MILESSYSLDMSQARLSSWKRNTNSETIKAYLSQPKMQLEGIGASLAQIDGRYYYDASSAEAVTIYMVDTVRLSASFPNRLLISA